MKRIPKPGEFYRHFQDKLYQIIAVAEHVQTGERLVIYQMLSGCYRVYAEPVSAFNAMVDREKYPQAHQRYCFELVDTALWSSSPEPSWADQSTRQEIPGVPDEEYLYEESDMDDAFDDSFEEVFFEDYEDDFEEDNEKAAGEQEKHTETKPLKSKQEEVTPAQWLERFLDADGYEKQLEVLNQMRGKVGMKELGSICLVLDVPLLAEDEDSQLSMIMRHLETRMRYDGRRLR